MTGWAAILRAAQTEGDVFRRACAEPRAAQLALLRRIIASGTASAFGSAHGFDRICSLETFRRQVPIQSYEALKPWIDRAAGGEAAVLTSEPVIAFEETGGSRGRKLVPYTQGSLRSFRAAVLPWLGDLADRRPGTFAGRVYVALSPAARAPRATAGGFPIGLPSEGAYLGDDLVSAFASTLAVSPDVADILDIERWRFVTLRSLLAAANLSFVSVWSPTFLLTLLQALPALLESLARSIHDGAIAGAPIGKPAGAPDPERARLISAAAARDPIDTRRIWPHLRTVSAWADGASRPYAKRVCAAFPHAHLEPKGLLATEGAVTVSWGGREGALPALTSAFLEFISEDGRALLCDELREGEAYRVVMTTPGGFYRYDLCDRVRCRESARGLPRLQFIGRAGVATDIVGEKLTEELVAEALKRADVQAFLAPRATERPYYELLLEAPPHESHRDLAASVEQSLRVNPQYAYARALGQLGPVMPRAVERLLDRYMQAEAGRGRRLADIKPPLLIDDSATYSALIK
jgi:GH3 auxin-responsive promoter